MKEDGNDDMDMPYDNGNFLLSPLLPPPMLFPHLPTGHPHE
jgi:hypothetical protein